MSLATDKIREKLIKDGGVLKEIKKFKKSDLKTQKDFNDLLIEIATNLGYIIEE